MRERTFRSASSLPPKIQAFTPLHRSGVKASLTKTGVDAAPKRRSTRASRIHQLGNRPSTTVVDRMRAEAIRAFDSGSTELGIDVVFAMRTNAAGAQCRATRAIATR